MEHLHTDPPNGSPSSLVLVLDNQPSIPTFADMVSQTPSAGEYFTDVSDGGGEKEEGENNQDERGEEEEDKEFTYRDFLIAGDVLLDGMETDFVNIFSQSELRMMGFWKSRERMLFHELETLSMPAPSSRSNAESVMVRVLNAQQEGRLRADLSRKRWGPIRPYFPPSDGTCLILRLSTEILQKIIDHAFFQETSKFIMVTDRSNGPDAFACVCRTFNLMVQHNIFNRVTLRSEADLHELIFLYRASPHMRPWLHMLTAKFSISNSVEAKRVGAALTEIIENCRNLSWISFFMDTKPGATLFFPRLQKRVQNLRNLREIVISSVIWHTPITTFLVHFDHLRVLNLRNTNLGKFRNTGKQARLRLPSVTRLSFDNCILGHNAIQMFAYALNNVEQVEATGVPAGIMELINAVMSRTSTLHSVTLQRCNAPPRPPLPTLKFWHRLEHIALHECFMLHPDFFPSVQDVPGLPNLRSLQVTANLRIPISPFDFDELIETIRRLPDLFSKREIFVPETGTTKSISNVNALVTCPLGTYKDTFGSALLAISSLRNTRNVLSHEYTILDTVGSEDDWEVQFIDDSELVKFANEVMNEWTNFPDNVFT
ncbi:hypothetical protein V1517DRAFT_322001 [Lipomyces orientalis]|uniref:Uncharacterized protein n=1 Tax=Lipomyces orientalis TaxID=1233043 RepID=A0ACC3TQ45_9ASCO